jgi:hypothetical protein
MGVIGKLFMDDMKGGKKGMSKTYCGYSKNAAEIHSSIHIQVENNEPGFIGIMRNDYALTEGSAVIKNGPAIGDAEDSYDNKHGLNMSDFGAFEYFRVKN